MAVPSSAFFASSLPFYSRVSIILLSSFANPDGFCGWLRDEDCDFDGLLATIKGFYICAYSAGGACEASCPSSPISFSATAGSSMVAATGAIGEGGDSRLCGSCWSRALSFGSEETAREGASVGTGAEDAVGVGLGWGWTCCFGLCCNSALAIASLMMSS